MRPTVYSSHGKDSYPARLFRALLSAIVPGLGQLVAGVRGRAFVLLGIFALVTGAGIFVLTRGVDALASWAVQPKVLLILLYVDIVIMLVRLYAVIDAWITLRRGAARPAGPHRGRLALTGMGLALVLLFTVAPHAVAGYYTVVSRSLLTTVFVGDDHSTTTSTSVAPTTSSTAAASETTAHPGTSATASSTSLPPTTATSATTTTSESPALGSDGRLTILLIGTDAGYGRTGARSDSMNVVSLNLETGEVAMFGLPRNTINTPLGPKTAKALGKKTFPDLLNALYGQGKAHPEIATDGGDPGAEAVRETASLILGIPIDYYAVVNMMGLVDMVNAVGGVDVYVEKALHITYAPLNAGEGKKTYVFKVGVNHLDGLEALAFARDRVDSNDYVRMGRQRCVLMALLYQNSVSRLTLRFPKIAGALKKNVKTNIPVDALPDLIKMRSDLKTGDMITVGFTPPDWTKSGTTLDFPKVKAAVRTILDDPQQWIADHPEVTEAGGASDCWKRAK